MTDEASATAGSTSANVTARLLELARTEPGLTPVVSVYLDTRWTDEHQRERVRLFLKEETRKAAAMAGGQLDTELAWITAQGERIVRQDLHPDRAGVAMFAGGTAHLRETLHLAVPFTDTFTVGDLPRLRPLVAALGAAPRAAVVFVDGETARLVTLTEQGAEDELVLTAGDPLGHHRRGGFLLLMQSRYQRHIQVHRARHFEAVARALAAVVDHYALRAIVLAGETRNLAVFRTHVAPRVTKRIVGEIAAMRWEPASALAERALTRLGHHVVGELALTIDTVLAGAGGRGRAAAGIDATLDAVNRGTVDRLFVLDAYEEAGRLCVACRTLQRGARAQCQWCGAATGERELAEAMVRRVLATGGDVATIDVHAGLARAGGVAAVLRYLPR
jgi:hypothetical protein